MDNQGKEVSKLDKFLEKDKKKHRAEFVVSIIFNIILYYVANNLLNWNISFIAPTFANVLWIVNYFLLAAIIINLIFIFYHPNWFRNLLHVVIDVLFIITAYTFFTVFPFIVGEGLAIALKILIALVIVASVISLIIHVVRFILLLIYRD
ncbi:MAG TPA: hypothetical protein PL055_05635 [Methanobacterium sp.]|jgi:hypothetical protein|nr:MAG: hypothetical protein FGO69_04745 [Methanobacterium sp.]HOI39833.1 hypothetical protein [Methanobacterium sp.]HOI70975.1 hypothetical protein [Methanobacterium sp.]HPX78227.1 hypothetical protein [Methanobacterium sp.]